MSNTNLSSDAGFFCWFQGRKGYIFFMNTFRKQRWYQSELIALLFLEWLGYHTIEKNYTIRGGEIDLIMSYQTKVVFVEVKCIDVIQDVIGYITHSKIKALKKTIEWYCREKKLTCDIQLDIIFVKWDKVVDHLSNIYL